MQAVLGRVAFGRIDIHANERQLLVDGWPGLVVEENNLQRSWLRATYANGGDTTRRARSSVGNARYQAIDVACYRAAEVRGSAGHPATTRDQFDADTGITPGAPRTAP